MKFGLDLPGIWADHSVPIENLYPEMAEVVRYGCEIGLDSFVWGEHHFMDRYCTPDPIALACYFAPLTTTQRLVVSVMQLPLHSVLRLAGSITMADHLTKGRLEVGFGRGGANFEFDKFGLDNDPDKRRAKMDEQLDALQRLFREKDVTFKGRFEDFSDITIMPPVYQKPLPPIWLSAMRPEAAYHIAKRGFSVQTGQLRKGMDYVREMVDAFQNGAKEAPADLPRPRSSMLQWVYVAKDDADAKHKLDLAYEAHRRFWGLLTDTGKVVGGRVQPVDVPGTPESYADTMIIGTKNFVLDRLLEMHAAGFDELQMRMHFGAGHADVMGSLDRLSAEILPAFAEEAPARVVAS